jgi:hypothetical protein
MTTEPPDKRPTAEPTSAGDVKILASEYSTYPRDEVIALQTSMREGPSHFSESELARLGVVVRLTVEFFHSLQKPVLDTADPEDLRYVDESVISGIDSFMSLCQAYRYTLGESRSTLPQSIVSMKALAESFIAVYRQFAQEKNFEKKCRLLIYLFKLQIIFVGLTYD